MKCLNILFVLIFQINVANGANIVDSTFKRHSVSLSHAGLNFLDGFGLIMFKKPLMEHLRIERFSIPNLFNYQFEYSYSAKGDHFKLGASFMPWSYDYIPEDEEGDEKYLLQPSNRYLWQLGVFVKYKLLIDKAVKIIPTVGINYRYGETNYFVKKFDRHNLSDGQFYRSLGPNLGISVEVPIYKMWYIKTDFLYQYYFEKYNACECRTVMYSEAFKKEFPNRQFIQLNLGIGYHFNVKIRS